MAKSGFAVRSKSRKKAGREGLRLALVDDDESVHLAVRAAIEAEAKAWTLDLYASGADALRGIPPARPDVVLMDIRMPEPDGIECTRRLRIFLPELPVVMFTAYSGRREILRSIAAGACGYLLKPVDADSLVRAVRNANAGQPALCPEALSALLGAWQAAGAANAATGLSSREREMVPLLAQGLTYGQIALRLGIETATVHAHLKRLYRKLAAHSRSEAVRRAFGLPLGR